MLLVQELLIEIQITFVKTVHPTVLLVLEPINVLLALMDIHGIHQVQLVLQAMTVLDQPIRIQMVVVKIVLLTVLLVLLLTNAQHALLDIA